MILKEYMETRGISVTDMAERLNIGREYIYALLRGRSPSLKLAKTIEIVTEGEVGRLEALWPEDYETVLEEIVTSKIKTRNGQLRDYKNKI